MKSLKALSVSLLLTSAVLLSGCVVSAGPAPLVTTTPAVVWVPVHHGYWHHGYYHYYRGPYRHHYYYWY